MVALKKLGLKIYFYVLVRRGVKSSSVRHWDDIRLLTIIKTEVKKNGKLEMAYLNKEVW